MKLVFATSNKGKLHEAANILGPEYELLTPADLGILEDIPETGSTLAENSMQKARYIYDRTGLDCFADDTGLEVDCLDGAPGIYSARYAGPGHDFEANIVKLLADIEAKGPDAPRSARFRCVVTLILNGEVHTFDGLMEGRIAKEKKGDRGFGYDPIFIPDEGDGHTLAEEEENYKNSISHRGRSLRALAAWLKENR